MTVSVIIISVLVTFIGLLPFLDATHVHICIRYNLAGPCELIHGLVYPPYIYIPPHDLTYQYCKQACSEEQSHRYNPVCKCAPLTTTTATTTTTEPPCETSYLEQIVCDKAKKHCSTRKCQRLRNKVKALVRGITTCDCPLKQDALPAVCDRADDQGALCMSLKGWGLIALDTECLCPGPTSPLPPLEGVCYYSSVRNGDTTDLARRKRIYSGKPASPDCSYPGIVGLVKDIGTVDQSIVCTGVLVDEISVLISRACKDDSLDVGVFIHVKSYKVAEVTKDIEIDVNKITPLSDSMSNELYIVKLNKKVEFDKKCQLPACLPNKRMSSKDINFDDCRMVGYGSTEEDFFSPRPDKLQEIKVTVDKSSITESILKVTRTDAKSSIACMEDDSAPLMCKTKETDEWVVVGIVTSPGIPCSADAVSMETTVLNLLDGGSKEVDYFSKLSETKYAKEGSI